MDNLLSSCPLPHQIHHAPHRGGTPTGLVRGRLRRTRWRERAGLRCVHGDCIMEALLHLTTTAAGGHSATSPASCRGGRRRRHLPGAQRALLHRKPLGLGDVGNQVGHVLLLICGEIADGVGDWPHRRHASIWAASRPRGPAAWSRRLWAGP